MYPILPIFYNSPQVNMAFIDLLTRIGFTNVQATAIIGEGITDPEDLVTYTHSDKTFFKHLSNRQVHPPFGLQHKFQILCYWVEKRIPLGLSVDSELFTNVELVTWGEKMKTAADEKDAQKPTIAAPGAYKKDTKWRVWKEQFLNYMGTKNGQNKAPLPYILRPDDDPANEGDVSTNDIERMVYLMPHRGLAYQYDNGMVYDELKALLVNNTAFTRICVHNRARNGRAAWKALVEHYEGPTEQNKVIEAAYHTI
jgi:hypothetical protein